jgi:hypothetical protein
VNCSFECHGINTADFAVNDFTFLTDEYGVKRGAGPIVVKSIDERKKRGRDGDVTK